MKNERYFYQIKTNYEDDFNRIIEITKQQLKTLIKTFAIQYVKNNYISFAPLQITEETEYTIREEEIIEHENGIMEIITIFKEKK